MTDRTPTPSPQAAKDPEVREAKGAAREAIGKLLGDDQAVRDGRSEQREVEADPEANTDAAGENTPRAKISKTKQE